MKHTLIDASQLELNEKVVSIKRVTKVVKGGRNMRFTALVVVGDGNGHVGAGLGKAAEIPEAIRKGKEDAAKKLIKVDLDENASIPHDYTGKFGGASVLLKRSPEGTGVIAGWNLDGCTFDLHHDENMNEGNVMTEYEEKFSSMGNPIYKMIISR